MRTIGILASITLCWAAAPQVGSAQLLDSLVAEAIAQNPVIVAAQERIHAAAARVNSSGARPDPILSLSLQNLPVSEPGFEDFMTMKSIGLSQRLPYPGKLSLARDAARGEVGEANASLEELQLNIVRDVRQTYYDLVFIDRALAVVTRHAGVLSALVRTADVRYAVGTAGQEDVLQAQVETAALADEAARLTEGRWVALATLNRLLDRPPVTEVDDVALPERIASAVTGPVGRPSFVSLDPGARVAGSPLRPLAELLAAVVVNSPTIHVHEARIEAQRARLDLAQKAHLPDFDIALSYAQRDNRTDMVSLSVAVPLPINRGARQDAWTAEAQAALAALMAEHRGHANGLQARVAQLYADLEKDRSSLALLTTGMLPQESAALQAATASFGVGSTDFQTVLATQTALFRYETSYHRLVTDFAKNLAELEQLVAEEVLR